MKFDIESYSNIGKRNENQDNLSYKIINDELLIACIADGVGGKLGGSQSSLISVNYFMENPYDQNLKEIVLKIHDKILDEAINDSNYGMATTFTGIKINANKLTGIHVGDTRACILRGNGIKQLTQDHSEVARLVKEGKLTFQEALNYPRKNVIESALGIQDRNLLLYEFNFDIEAGDRIILTTDGVHQNVSKKEFRDISIKSTSSNDFLKDLIKCLEIKEPSDNNSIIVITVI